MDNYAKFSMVDFFKESIVHTASVGGFIMPAHRPPLFEFLAFLFVDALRYSLQHQLNNALRHLFFLHLFFYLLVNVAFCYYYNQTRERYNLKNAKNAVQVLDFTTLLLFLAKKHKRNDGKDSN